MRALLAIVVVSVLTGGIVRAQEAPQLPDEPPDAEAPVSSPSFASPHGAAPPASSPPVAQPGAPVAPAAVVPDPARRFPRLKRPSLLHRDQFGLSVMPGSGYRIIAPYKDNVPCGQINTRVCAGRIPVFLDAQASFGFAAHWDVIVDLRFGLEADFSQSHQFAVAPGVRYWVDADQPAKFFATIQGVYDLNPQHEPGVKDYDLGVRNANGFMFEVMRNLGFYLQFGETVGLVRWLRFEVDGGLGVQARFP